MPDDMFEGLSTQVVRYKWYIKSLHKPVLKHVAKTTQKVQGRVSGWQ